MTGPTVLPIDPVEVAYRRGYDDGWNACDDSENEIDARNRTRLDELRRDASDALYAWDLLDEYASEVAVIDTAELVVRATRALVEHCAPRAEADR